MQTLHKKEIMRVFKLYLLGWLSRHTDQSTESWFKSRFGKESSPFPTLYISSEAQMSHYSWGNMDSFAGLKWPGSKPDDYTRQQNFTFFGPRGKISNPNRAFNAEFTYVSSLSPSPTVFL